MQKNGCWFQGDYWRGNWWGKDEDIWILWSAGILLDNAIEAAKDSVEKKVEVFMKREERALTFIVLNGINEKVDVTMIYEKGYSTKEKDGAWALEL